MSLADEARATARSARVGTLCTLDPDGFPFGSLVNLALDAAGRPVLLISRLAEHTRHLEKDPRASLLLAAPQDGGDPLAAARVTLLGRVHPLEDAAARQAFLTAHPAARAYAAFPDFSWHLLEPERIRIVAGFGRMGWLTAAEYATET